MKDPEKLIYLDDDDVKITYERRSKKADTDDINGFNPIILVGAFIAVIIALVVISQNNETSAPVQQTPVIINNN